jgi:hypothetical protein
MDRREHAERQDVDLQQPERVEIVLVPLDHGTLRHGGIFYRHQAGQRAARDDEAADMLRQVAGKTAQGVGQCQPFGDARRRRIEADGAQAFGQLLAFVPPGQRGGQGVDLGAAKAEARPTSRKAPRVR